jgi:hypothetical protein
MRSFPYGFRPCGNERNAHPVLRNTVRHRLELKLRDEGLRMQDVVMLLFTVVFFAVAFLYVKACQKLR